MVTPEPTAVHIKSDVMPLLVAYRDGFDVPGKPVPWTMVQASTLVTFMAHDMYSVVVVCQTSPTTVLTWQSLRTVGDDVTDTVKEPTLTTPCVAAGPAVRTISGTAAGAGFVHVDGDDKATTANGTFSLNAVDGTYDFVVSDTTAKKALITRDFVVDGDNPNASAQANAATGMGLVSVTPALSNPPPPPDPKDATKNTETVLAQIEVLTKNNSLPARISTADFVLDTKVNKDQTVALLAMPDAALTKDDEQRVRFTGTNPIAKTNITTTRSVWMPFKMGDDVTKGKTALTLPSRLATSSVEPGWGLVCSPAMPTCADSMKNLLSVALPALPALDEITIETSGTSATDMTKTAMYEMHITAGYLNDTSLARPLFDTDVQGFQAAWKIDFNQAYSREITTEHDTLDDDNNFVDHETSVFREDVDAP